MLWLLQYEPTQLYLYAALSPPIQYPPIVWLIRFQQPHLQGTTRMLRAAINVLSDISSSLLYWDWGSESLKETPHFHLLLRPFAELSSANGLNLRLKIFLSDSNIPPPRRFVASLSHGFQPQTMEFRIRRNFWRIRAAFRVGQSLMRWRAGFGQSAAISCSASPLLSPFSTTTCLTGSHTIFKPFL